jgi:hypothetical protein
MCQCNSTESTINRIVINELNNMELSINESSKMCFFCTEERVNYMQNSFYIVFHILISQE